MEFSKEYYLCIRKWREQDRNCIEVLRQITLVTGALRGVWTELVGEHLRGCVTRAVQDDDYGIIDEFIEHLRKIR